MQESSPLNSLEQEYIIDEQRGVVVNKRDMNTFQHRIYNQTAFKSYRPDLNEFDYLVFLQKWQLGEAYLGTLKQKLNMEFTRLYMQTPFTYRREKMREYEDQVLQLSGPNIKGCKFHANRNWSEATLISTYVDQLFSKVRLHVPAFCDKVDNPKNMEKELTERFIREMRNTSYLASQ